MSYRIHYGDEVTRKAIKRKRTWPVLLLLAAAIACRILLPLETAKLQHLLFSGSTAVSAEQGGLAEAVEVFYDELVP